MLVCKECEVDVYIQQRAAAHLSGFSSYDEPYYCWNCEKFRDYSEVKSKK